MSSHHYRYRPSGFHFFFNFFRASVAFCRASWALRSSASWASKSFSILSTLTAANFRSDLFVLSRNSCLVVVKFSCVSRKAEAAASTHSAFFSTVFFDVWNFLSMSVEHFEAISFLTSSIWSFKMSVFLSDQATWIAPWSPQAWMFLERCSCRVLLLYHSRIVGMTFSYLCIRRPLAYYTSWPFGL